MAKRSSFSAAGHGCSLASSGSSAKLLMGGGGGMESSCGSFKSGLGEVASVVRLHLSSSPSEAHLTSSSSPLYLGLRHLVLSAKPVLELGSIYFTVIFLPGAGSSFLSLPVSDAWKQADKATTTKPKQTNPKLFQKPKKVEANCVWGWPNPECALAQLWDSRLTALLEESDSLEKGKEENIHFLSHINVLILSLKFRWKFINMKLRFHRKENLYDSFWKLFINLEKVQSRFWKMQTFIVKGEIFFLRNVVYKVGADCEK